MGQVWYGREWFQKRIAPALRWWVKRDGDRPLTDSEKVIKGFALDMEPVETVADLDLHWRAQKKWTVPQEVKRG